MPVDEPAESFKGVLGPGGVAYDLAPCASMDDIVRRIFPVLLAVGPHLGRDPVLLAKLARLARLQIEEVWK